MAKLTCEILTKSNAVHLQQLFNGFNLLYKNGVVDIRVRKANFSGLPGNKPIVKVIVNDTHHLVYDLLDGYNFFDDGTIEENLRFMDGLLEQCDYYYKRSCSTRLNAQLAQRDKVRPLGLNYLFSLDERDSFIQQQINRAGAKARLRHLLKGEWSKLRPAIPRNILAFPRMSEWIQQPGTYADPKAIFIPRLWQEDQVPASLRGDFAAINAHRIGLVRQLKQHFRQRFIGGILEDDYSRRVCPDLCVAYPRQEYVRIMNEAAVCIATEGLHGSIGWKFAEYLLASKCIVTEPLQYELPGDFRPGSNYLQFETIDDCIEKVDSLLGDAGAMSQMMQRNYAYAQQYLYPEAFVLRTLQPVM